jgi:hypothetical protein
MNVCVCVLEKHVGWARNRPRFRSSWLTMREQQLIGCQLANNQLSIDRLLQWREAEKADSMSNKLREDDWLE